MFMMWTPKPKGKVIRRPKLSVKQRPRARATAAEEKQPEKSDPHRETRYFGVKHSDITQVFFVDSTNFLRKGPIGPFEKKQTDITAYLQHSIPSHACQTASVNGQIVRVQGKQTELGDIRACYPCRLPSACNNSRRSRRDHVVAGAHQNENIRPKTAPTGEMRRLSEASVASFGHTPSLSAVRSDTAGSKGSSCSKVVGSVQAISRPGTKDSGLGSVACSAGGSMLGSLQCSSRLLTGNCCAFGSRLQSVPE